MSPERLRDEFFQILNGKNPAVALEVLYQLGLLEHLVPEAALLHGVQQSPPHQLDVWRHTLKTVEGLDTILHLITPHRDDNLTANLQYGMIAAALNAVREPLQDHLRREWPNGRTERALIILAALLHDAGKPAARSVDADGDSHFYRHEQISEQIAITRAAALRLSNDESDHLAAIVRHHMRPHWLNTNPPLTARAVYRFWLAAGPAGVDICLLAMADYLATYGTQLDSRVWVGYLENIQSLLERYFLQHETAIAPPALIGGQDLLETFHLQPGPQIGQLLEQVREAQVIGDITTKKEALDWVQRLLDSQG
jgi:tRNA nucleotidyltransferase/poly(A) polymerase